MRQVVITAAIFVALFIAYQLIVVTPKYKKLAKQIADAKESLEGQEETTAAEVVNFITDSGTNDEPTVDEQMQDVTQNNAA